MATFLKQSTAATVKIGPFLDDTDGNTVEGALTISQADVRLSKNGGNIAQKNEATSCTHDELGWYDCPLDATDTNTLGILTLVVHETGALQVWHDFMVLPANVYDSLIGGSDTLQADVTQWLGTAAATPTVAGVPEVDITHLGGVAQSLTDLKDFADDGYDPATNKVQGVVLVDTLTTYTGNTPQTGDSFARLGAPAGASVSADIAAIEAQTDDIGAAGAGLTAVPWNAAWDAEVESEVNDALVALSLDKLVLVSGTADSGSTTTMVDAARTEADADYWKGRLIVFTSGVIQGQCAIITDFNAGTDTFTFAPALTQAVATQTYVILPGISVWDDTLAEHLAAGSTGNALNAAGSAGDPWSTALPGAYGAGTAGKIVGDNLNETVSSRASQTSVDTVDTNVDSILADTGTDGVVLANDAITNAKIAANAIGASELAADAVAEIADAVWDEATSGHVAAGTFGLQAGSDIDSILAATSLIVADTNELQTDWVDGGRLDNILDARASQTSVDTIDDFLDTEVAAILEDTGTTIPAQITALNNLSAAQVNAEVDTALADVNLDHLVGTATGIPAVPAGTFLDQIMDDGTAAFDRTTDSLQAIRDKAADIETDTQSIETKVDTVDTNVDAILVDTGTTLQAELDGIQADTEDIQSRIPAALTAGGNMKADSLAVNGNTTAAAQLARSAATIVNAAAIAGTLSTTQMSTDLTEATNDHYNGRIIIWTSGVLLNQATDITAYNGTTKVLTYTAVTEAPSAADSFIIV